MVIAERLEQGKDNWSEKDSHDIDLNELINIAENIVLSCKENINYLNDASPSHASAGGLQEGNISWVSYLHRNLSLAIVLDLSKNQLRIPFLETVWNNF